MSLQVPDTRKTEEDGFSIGTTDVAITDNGIVEGRAASTISGTQQLRGTSGASGGAPPAKVNADDDDDDIIFVMPITPTVPPTGRDDEVILFSRSSETQEKVNKRVVAKVTINPKDSMTSLACSLPLLTPVESNVYTDNDPADSSCCKDFIVVKVSHVWSLQVMMSQYFLLCFTTDSNTGTNLTVCNQARLDF